MTTYSPGLGASGGGAPVVIVDANGDQATVTDGKLDVNASVSTVGLATSVNQETLNSLIETLNELNARLMVLASMANSGQPALRVIPIASVATAVSGSLTTVTSVGSLTNIGTVPANVVAWSQQNLLVTQANINNATA